MYMPTGNGMMQAVHVHPQGAPQPYFAPNMAPAAPMAPGQMLHPQQAMMAPPPPSMVGGVGSPQPALPGFQPMPPAAAVVQPASAQPQAPPQQPQPNTNGNSSSGKKDDPSQAANRYRTAMCRNASAEGGCPYEAHCMYAHSEEELRTWDQNFADGLTTDEAIKAFHKKFREEKRLEEKKKRVAEKKKQKWLLRQERKKAAALAEEQSKLEHVEEIVNEAVRLLDVDAEEDSKGKGVADPFTDPSSSSPGNTPSSSDSPRRDAGSVSPGAPMGQSQLDERYAALPSPPIPAAIGPGGKGAVFTQQQFPAASCNNQQQQQQSTASPFAFASESPFSIWN